MKPKSGHISRLWTLTLSIDTHAADAREVKKQIFQDLSHHHLISLKYAVPSLNVFKTNSLLTGKGFDEDRVFSFLILRQSWM